VTQSVILQGARPCESHNNQIRVGYTVSRKVGGAVVRNKVKRRLRAAVREILSQKEWSLGDVVLIARPGSFDHPYADLVANVRWGLSHLERVLKEDDPT